MPLVPKFSPDSSRDDSGAERGRRRLRRIQWTAAAAVGGRGAMILVTLCTIPLTVKYLGSAQYGYWVAILSTTTLMAFADLGLGYGLLNRAAAVLGAGAIDDGRRLVSNAFLMLTGVGLTGLFFAGMAYYFLPWARWFPGTDPASAAECGQAVIVLTVLFLVGLPFTTWHRTVGAVQMGFWSPCWDALGSIMSLAGLLVVVSQKGGLVALATAYAVGPCVALVAGWLWFFFGSRPDLRPRWSDRCGEIARSMLAEGGYYLALQVGGLLLVSGVSLTLLQRCGSAELAHYSLAAKLFQFGPQLAAFWFAPLWPAYSEALARRDVDWAQRTLRTTTGTCMAAGLLGSVILVPMVDLIVGWWTGLEVETSYSFRWALAGMTVLGVATTSVSTFLNASGYLSGQVWLVGLQILTTLGSAWLLAPRWGSAGVAWSVVAGYGLIVVPAYLLIVPRLLTKQRRSAASLT
jgi:O-antigen/teichoic acid export membrane protein